MAGKDRRKESPPSPSHNPGRRDAQCPLLALESGGIGKGNESQSQYLT